MNYIFSDIPKNTMNYNYGRYNSYTARRNRQSSRLGEGIKYAVLITALMILFGWAFSTGIDKHIQNQDTMLCESAKISGNSEYLQKCQCYYNGQPIICLQK
jgi:hypothetical protein